jgi:hypothetical protein
MTDNLDWPPILDAIEEGIKKARQQKLEAGEEVTDDYSAFVVLRELHLKVGASLENQRPDHAGNDSCVNVRFLPIADTRSTLAHTAQIS